MRLNIDHRTVFQYDEPPSYGLLQLRTTPQTSAAQRVISWATAFEGGQEQVRFLDHHGNLVQLIEVLPDTTRISIDVKGEVETLSEDGVYGHHRDAMPTWFYRRQSALTEPTQDIRAAGEALIFSAENTISDLHALSQLIRDRVAYVPGETDISTTAGEAWSAGTGVCQDHTHIFLSIVREKGLPARYVSGYLLMDDRADQDASHAWAEVCIDGLGWVGFDVSNGISPDARYVRIAQGADYMDAAPTTGLTLGAGQENLSVSIQVQQ
ncbi:MAG: transglutaminase family protein [Pseudomonadota bacterium]